MKPWDENGIDRKRFGRHHISGVVDISNGMVEASKIATDTQSLIMHLHGIHYAITEDDVIDHVIFCDRIMYSQKMT